MSRRDSGSLGEQANFKKPIVFGKYAYRLWITLCVMAGIGMISLVLIMLIAFGGF